jgi:eukaryotic-like serine/threonine-protein kinase
LAAVAGRPLSRRILLAGTPQGERGRPDVFRLAHERLLRETWTGSEPAVEPYHGYVRDAVLDTMNDEARRACHRTIAEVLLQEPEVDADALVDHFVGAGDFARAGSYAEIAAKRAEETLAFDRAIHLYRLALDHRPSGPRHTLRAHLGAVLASAGRSSESADAYAEAARDAALAGAHGEAHTFERVAAENSLRGGDFEIGVRRLRSVLSTAGVPWPSSAVSAFATIVQQRSLLAMRGVEFVERQGPVDPRLLARADACWAAGVGLTWIDRTRVAAFQSRYIRLALSSGDAGRVALALSTEASQLACLGGAARRKRAHGILARAKEMTDRQQDPVPRAFIRLMDASIEFYASHWQRVVALCAEAEDILREAKLRSEWEHLTSNTLSLPALAYTGDLVTLRARQTELIAEAHERGNRLAFACLASGPANLGFLVAGDPAVARRRADEALAPWKNESFQLAHYLHLVAHCQIDLYAERPEATLERLEREWRRVQLSMSLQVQNFRVTLRHVRGRAAIASALRQKSRRKRMRLLDRARVDAKSIAADDVAWAMPLARSLEGGIAAANDDVPLASRHLAAAAAGFRDLDMLLHATSADFQRGRLLGGDAGRALEREAEAWLVGTSQRVASPELISKMLVPGVEA